MDDDAAKTEPDGAAVAERAGTVLRQLAGGPPKPALYVVATPIGNLADITLRALAVLARADLVYCEDTRHSRTLLSHFGISRGMRPYHEHNAEAERPRILEALRTGKSVVLISDAGTPLISDPGYKLVREAADAGATVTVLPGASAVTAALAVAGLPTDTFLFAGFLPARAGQRRSRLLALKAVPASLVFFEAPSRLAEALADMGETLGEREAVVARELTKLHEEVRRGSLAELAAWAAAAPPRGEMVVLVGPGREEIASEEDVRARLAGLLETMSVRDAAKVAAETMGIPKARAYDLALAVKAGSAGGDDT
ncbi:MAG: 16S rRNA (cytidine(1402)-2'-O)-methyltransferase [Hyphomicrobiaceae bacterium]|nr:16S rRNA (cytidine(1402)-2'-O)-methyltransferase [Hyphomicrobiaceae bacterium]